MAKTVKSFKYGNHDVTLETGEIARQASGAVVVKMSDTVVLVSVVGAKSVREGTDFFPLTVDYQEKFYAGGRIPGGFFKREGRPTEKETLTSRLIDRPIRPLFPEEMRNEVQIIATVLSLMILLVGIYWCLFWQIYNALPLYASNTLGVADDDPRVN
ncbi:MAG TPA: hypothetical protein PLB00_01415, partial [Pseudomonadota bacterium]|nr:hypothetical protein [Pseudomonadota bacterium]